MKMRSPVHNALLLWPALVGLLSLSYLAWADQKSPTEPVNHLAHFRVAPGKPNTLAFSPTPARFIRIVIQKADNGQACIDELEVYAADDQVNLALACRGAKASASSCLPGYAIHQTP